MLQYVADDRDLTTALQSSVLDKDLREKVFRKFHGSRSRSGVSSFTGPGGMTFMFGEDK